MRKNYEKLIVWQMGMELVIAIYRATRRFPDEEKFGLCAQLRRAAVSIPSNIAEGSARRSRHEFKQFLYIAKGSLLELETQLRISQRLNYLDAEQALFHLTTGLFIKLNALIDALKTGYEATETTNHELRTTNE